MSGTSFGNMEKKTITFPSVVEYLDLSSKVKIGTKTVAIERVMAKNDDADSGDESYDLSNDEESEEEEEDDDML